MATYRIVCTEKETVYVPTAHTHIVAVGTGSDPNSAEQRWTLQEVIDAMDRGDEFYTQGQQSGKVARVEKYNCHLCRRTYIRSMPDAVHDNNLDSLRQCAWKS